MEEQSDLALAGIVGARLTSVQFVMDYLILGFDAKGALTTLVWPEVAKGSEVTRFGAIDYRNRLCELIGIVVHAATMRANDVIEIRFSGGSELRIPLSAPEGEGERAILTGPGHFLKVW